MTFLGKILAALQGFFESIFASSSPEYQKKRQLRNLTQEIKTITPPIYQQDGKLLPAFAMALFQIYQFLEPIRSLFLETLSSSDRRVAEKFRDYLIELSMTKEQLSIKQSFSLSSRTEDLVAATAPPERIIEDQGHRFSQFIKSLETASFNQAGVLLEKLDLLNDFCSFDFNNFLSYFDPAFQTHSGFETSVHNPSFTAVEVAELVPVLLDFYYVLSVLDISPPIVDVVSILEAKKNGAPLDDEIRSRTQRVFQAVSWLIAKKLSKNTLLAIIKVTKRDPEFVPKQPKLEQSYLAKYKERLTERFHTDSRKLLEKQREDETNALIQATFGDRPLEPLNGYNETTNILLQEFTMLSLEWIKPLEIIKTFSKHYFDAHFKQILKSVIVEGYFINRSLQTALSSSYYFCEAIPLKLAEFEALFNDKEPFSLTIVKGYLTELEKGMDFETPLRKMVENMNFQAKNLVQLAVNNFADVFNFTTLLLDDNKKSVPEAVTNIRTLSGSTKNRESFNFLEKERGLFRNFLEIMKKYAIVGTISGTASAQAEMES